MSTPKIKLKRRFQRPADVTQPVPLPVDFASVSPHERDVARYRSEDSRTGQQVDETPPTVKHKKKRGLRHVRTGR